MRRAVAGTSISARSIMPDEVLYSDDCCEVTSEGVRIKWYFFPTATSKFVKYGNLKMIHPTPEKSLSMFDTKGWGMGMGKTWWACAPMSKAMMGVRLKYSIALQDTSWCRHGFTVRDREGVLAAIANGLKSKGLEVPHAANA